MRGKRSPPTSKRLPVRGCGARFQDRAEWALWQLSLILAEIAGNTSGNKSHTADSLPSLDEKCKNGDGQNLPY